MRKFVFWTGIYDIVMAGTISCPWVIKMLGVPLPESYFWLWFAAALVIYLGTVLVISSRNMKARACHLLRRDIEVNRLCPDGRVRLIRRPWPSGHSARRSGPYYRPSLSHRPTEGAEHHAYEYIIGSVITCRPK